MKVDSFTKDPNLASYWEESLSKKCELRNFTSKESLTSASLSEVFLLDFECRVSVSEILAEIEEKNKILKEISDKTKVLLLSKDPSVEHLGINFLSRIYGVINSHSTPVVLQKAVEHLSIQQQYFAPIFLNGLVSKLAHGREINKSLLSVLEEDEKKIILRYLNGFDRHQIAEKTLSESAWIGIEIESALRKIGVTDKISLAVLLYGRK